MQPEVKTSDCPAEGTHPLPPAVAQQGDFVQLERTSCFGPCPVYSVKIQADGHVIWNGNRSVVVVGEDTATIRPSDARALIEKFRATDFWGLCGSYAAMVTDASTVITTLHLGDQEKRVSNYFNTAPSWLQPLEHEIDAVADTHRWIHGDPRAETFASIRLPNQVPSFPGIATGLGADFRGPKPGLTPLMQAAGKGDISEIQKQLAGKADRNAQDASGWTALMYATHALANQAQAVKILLDGGANPNTRSDMGQTALMALANVYSSPLESLRLLIGARADVNAQDSDGHTTLMFATYGALSDEDTSRMFLERADLMNLLREAGARTDLRAASGRTVFDYLDIEAGPYPYRKRRAEKLRQILQNPTPAAYAPVKVSGRVAMPSGATPWASTITFQRVGLDLAEVHAAVGRDGSFEIRVIQPGPYSVLLAPAPSIPLLPISVVIPNSDVAGLTIPLPAVKEVSVRAAVEGDTPVPNFALAFAASSGPASSFGPTPGNRADANAVVPPNILALVNAGAESLQLVRIGASPLVDDAVFRIALPSAWHYQVSASPDPASDGTFRITLPEGEYQVAAILPRVSARIPKIYTVTSLTTGSSNLSTESLKIPAPEPEIRVAFGTVTGGPWMKMSGRVTGIHPGDEQIVRVILNGELIGPLVTSVESDGSFVFPRLAQGRYILRVAARGAERAVSERRQGPSDTIINVVNADVTGIEIAWKPQ